MIELGLIDHPWEKAMSIREIIEIIERHAYEVAGIEGVRGAACIRCRQIIMIGQFSGYAHRCPFGSA